MVMEATEGVTDVVNSANSAGTLFTNDNEGLCPATYTIALVSNIDSNYAAGLISKFTFGSGFGDSDVEVQFDESTATQIDIDFGIDDYLARNGFGNVLDSFGNAYTNSKTASGIGKWWQADLNNAGMVSSIQLLSHT